MALTGQKTYSPRDIPTPTEFTAWMALIQEKFTPASGTQDITAADFKWPMNAGGNLNMNGNAISTIPRVGSVYNLATRRHWQTTTMIFDEVEAKGGGRVLLPGNTTITAQTEKDGLTGIRVGTNTAFIGHGATSVTGQLYMKDKEGSLISDMTITGASTLTNCTSITFKRCTFTGIGAHQLRLISCNNIRIQQCNFTGAATEHVRLENIVNIRIKGCYFNNYADLAIHILVDTNAAFGLQIVNNVFYHPAAYAGTTAYCVQITGSELRGAGLLVIGALNADVTIPKDCLRNQFRGNILADKTGGLRVKNINHIKVVNNIFADSSTSATMINTTRPSYEDSTGMLRSRASGLMISANIVGAAKDVGVFIQKSKNSVVRGNVLVCTDEALILDQPYIGGYSANRKWTWGGVNTVTGNSLYTADATLPAMALWGLVTSPTQLGVSSIVFGNHMDGASSRGYRSFKDQGSTAGGEIGDEPPYNRYVYWVFAGNNSQGTTVAGGANEDMKHMAAAATLKAITKSVCLSQTDDSTPINNI